MSNNKGRANKTKTTEQQQDRQRGVVLLSSLGLSVEVVRSCEDETVVVFIDTPGVPEDSEGPRLRVYLNEDSIWENPVYATIGESK